MIGESCSQSMLGCTLTAVASGIAAFAFALLFGVTLGLALLCYVLAGILTLCLLSAWRRRDCKKAA